jgi:predicted phosphodiesterase
MKTYREYSIATREWHKTLLNDDDKKFLREMLIVNKAHIGENSFFLAHASPQGDIFKYLNADEIDSEIKNINAEYILLGHTHVQYKKKIENTLVVNPGSVGLARDDGPVSASASQGGQACYAVFADGEIHLKRIDYNIKVDPGILNPLNKFQDGH